MISYLVKPGKLRIFYIRLSLIPVSSDIWVEVRFGEIESFNFMLSFLSWFWCLLYYRELESFKQLKSIVVAKATFSSRQIKLLSLEGDYLFRNKVI